MDVILVFTEKDLKIIFIGTAVGIIVQYACWKYVKTNPELFENLENVDDVDDEFAKEIAKEASKEIAKKTSKTQKLLKRIRPFLPRGGGLGEVLLKKIIQKIIRRRLKKLVKRLATDGVKEIFLGLVAALAVDKIPKKKALSTILRYTATKLKDGSPITHTKWNKLKYLSRSEIDPLSGCESSWKFILEVLLNKDLPYSVREEKVKILVRQSCSFQTKADLVRFMACMVGIILLLGSLKEESGIFILMQSLLDAVKQGKISKRIARRIIRRLMRKNVLVDIELLEGVAD